MNGVNLDALNPAGAPTPAQVKAAGFAWVRIVSRQGTEAYVASMVKAGIKVLAVIAAESELYVVPGATLYQLGNEPDITSGSSWTMPPQQYIALWNWMRSGEHKDKRWIVGGQASGQLDWWRAVAPQLHGAYGFAVHPYAKTAAEARPLLRELKAISPGLPCYVTEWNRPLEEVGSFASMLAEEAEASMWFCWSDGMVKTFGLTAPITKLFVSMVPKGPSSMTLNKVQDERIAQLQEQQALMFQAVRAFLEGRLDGEPDSATWLLAAVDPTVSIKAAPFEFGA